MPETHHPAHAYSEAQWECMRRAMRRIVLFRAAYAVLPVAARSCNRPMAPSISVVGSRNKLRRLSTVGFPRIKSGVNLLPENAAKIKNGQLTLSHGCWKNFSNSVVGVKRKLRRLSTVGYRKRIATLPGTWIVCWTSAVLAPD